MANRYTEAIRHVLGRDKPPQAKTELGATGTIIFSGQLIDTEYLNELKGEQGLIVYDKMRRSDGAVRAGLLACKLPLLVAHWDIQPGGDSAQDIQIADTVRHNLFDGMTITWDDFLRHTLLMLDFGFMTFEKVWELKDGLYQWHKLAPRLPITIKYWHTDPAGGLQDVEQWAWKENAYERITIPAEKLLVFSNEREGSNFAGVSILRAAYKHWYYKNNLYAIDGMAAERHGIGLAKFTYPDTASPDQKKEIENIGERLHAHERAYVALPDAIKFELMGVAGQLHDIKSSIEHHDLQIVRSILLAQFINIGAKDVGSFALSSDQSGFFLMALQSVGKQICDTVNRYAIPQMVNYNWDAKGKYPHLVVSGLEHYDVGAYALAISQVLTSGALTADRGIEAEVRRMLKLPVQPAGSEAGGPPEAPKGETKAAPPKGEQPIKVEGDTAENIVQGAKLNGIQITASLTVLTNLISGIIPPEVALELLVAVGIDRDKAEKMVTACQTFTPRQVIVPTGTQQAQAREILLNEMGRHNRMQCMSCTQPPTVEVLWAEGMAHAWFCDKHYDEWNLNHAKDVIAKRKLLTGIASVGWRYKHTEGPVKDARIPLQNATKAIGSHDHVWPRPLRPAEQHIAFAEIKGKLDGAEQRFVDTVAPIQQEQIKMLVDTIAGYIADKQYDRITEIDVPLRGKVADAVEALLNEMMAYGEEQVKKEQALQQGVKATDIQAPEIPGKRAFLRVKALAISNIMANKMRSALAWEALNQIKESIINKQALTDVLSGLSDIDTRRAIHEGLQDAFDVGASD